MQNIKSKYKVRAEKSFFTVNFSNHFLVQKVIKSCLLSIGIIILALILKKNIVTLTVLFLIFLTIISQVIYSLRKLRHSSVFGFNRVTKIITTEKEIIPLLNVSRLKIISELDYNDTAYYAVFLETKSGSVIQILDSYQRNEINPIVNTLKNYEGFNIPVHEDIHNI